MADTKDMTLEERVALLETRLDIVEETATASNEKSATKDTDKKEKVKKVTTGNLVAKSNLVKIKTEGSYNPVDLSTLDAKEVAKIAKDHPYFFQPKD